MWNYPTRNARPIILRTPHQDPEGSPAADRAGLAGQDAETAFRDILAYFDREGTSNGPTEAINGRLEHLRGSALGFRSLANYIARSLLEAGGFRPRLPSIMKSLITSFRGYS